MPRRYRRSRRRRSRRYRRRRRKRAPQNMRISVRRMPMLFPDNLRVTMKYSERIVFTLNQGVYTSYIWRLNSINDPDYAFGGSRPLGWDQWNAFYNDYICYASSISMSFMDGGTVPFEACIGPDSDPVGPATMQQAIEQPYYKYKVCNGAFAPQTRLHHKFAVKVLEGKRLGSDDTFQTGMASNPVNTKYWHLGLVQSLSGASVTVYCRFNIYYKVRLLRRKMTLARS